jgi:hypothetical protein
LSAMKDALKRYKEKYGNQDWKSYWVS